MNATGTRWTSEPTDDTEIVMEMVRAFVDDSYVKGGRRHHKGWPECLCTQPLKVNPLDGSRIHSDSRCAWAIFLTHVNIC